jgi:hypothetical protein
VESERERLAFAAEDFAAEETNEFIRAVLLDYPVMYRELRALRREVKRLKEVEDRYSASLWEKR